MSEQHETSQIHINNHQKNKRIDQESLSRIMTYGIYFSQTWPCMFFFSPGAVRHLVGTVVHPHQRFLVINARQHYDHRHVGNDQIQVAAGEAKVDGLKSKCQESGCDITVAK